MKLQYKQPFPKKSEYGHFDKDGAYVLTDPNTPRPWTNLISNDQYLLSIDQLSNGYSCYQSANINTVAKGRTFYLRDVHSGEFFCPTIAPSHDSLTDFEDYSCTYRPGEMIWNAAKDGISSRLHTMVCSDVNVELWYLSLSNTTANPRKLDVFFCLEWVFTGAPQECGFVIRSDHRKEKNTLVADVDLPPKYRACQTGFITASEPILDTDSRSQAFYGTLGSPTFPAAVRAGHCFNSGAPEIGGTCGAIRLQLDLPPNEARNALIAVGIAQDVAGAAGLSQSYRSMEVFDSSLNKVRDQWTQLLEQQRIERGDDPVLQFADTWLKTQAVQNARFPCYSGDKGFRDVLQASECLRFLDPASFRRTIEEALQHQWPTGHAPRMWPSAPWGGLDTRDYRDSCFWLVYAMDAYLRETGDTRFLDEPFPYLDSAKKESVWDHLVRAMDFLWEQRGSHGLCLIGQGDWLDSLNKTGLSGKGESVWLSQAYGWALQRMIEIGTACGKIDKNPEFQDKYVVMKHAVNQHGWDGNWYLAAFNDKGATIGSAKDADGSRIFLLPQSWAVISGMADTKRAQTSFAEVEKLLQTEAGHLLYAPRYGKYDPDIGRITIGASEADSVYIHAVTFHILAQFMAGKADAAWDNIRKLTPAARVLPASQTGAEPFSVTNAFAGNGWPWPGWTFTSWYTSTGAWMLRLIVEWLLGARAELDGLRIDPHLPSDWEKARIVRHFRGKAYDIRVTGKGEGREIAVNSQTVGQNALLR